MTQSEHLHDVLTGQHLTFLQSARETAGELLQLEVASAPEARRRSPRKGDGGVCVGYLPG